MHPRVADLMAEAKAGSPEERAMQLEDAQLHLSEFESPSQKRVTKSRCQLKQFMIYSLFKLLDADDNGYIDFEEILKAANQLGFPFESEEAAHEAFKLLDTAGDGRVNEAEFTAWWQNHGPDDEIRRQLAAKFSSRVDKLGSHAHSRGVMFG